MGHAADDGGPVGVAVAVVRGRELYVATVGPAEAYLIRQARLLDPARSQPGPRPAGRGARARGVARRALGRRLPVPRVGEHRRQDRDGRPQGRPRHAPPAVGHRAPPRALRGRRRQGERRRPRVRGERGRGDLQVEVARPGPARRAARRRAGQVADPARRHGDVGRGGDRGRGDAGEERRGQRLPARDLAIQDLLPHRKTGARKVTGTASRDGDAATGGRRPARVRRRGRRPRARRVRGRRPAAAPGRHQVADGRGERVRCRQGGPRGRDRPRRRPHQRRPQPGPRAPQPRVPAARPGRERRLPHRADRAAARDSPVRARPHLPGDLDQVVAAVHVPQGQAGPADGPRPWARRGAVRARHRRQDRVADRPRQEDGDAGPQVRPADLVGARRRPEVHHHRRAGRPGPRHQEPAVALAAREQRGPGVAGPDPGQELGVAGATT